MVAPDDEHQDRSTFSQRVLSRRRFLRSQAALAAAYPATHRATVSLSSSSLTCPDLRGQTIRWIVPNSIGGGNDTYSRMIEPFLETRLGAEIVIDNRPGAAGLVGSLALKNARPDGLKLGLLNSSGLMISALVGLENTPDPIADFEILGRVSRSQHIWVTGRQSGLRDMQHVTQVAKTRPLLFGVSNVSSQGFVDVTIGTSLLGLNAEIVTGFGGSRSASLAAMRGDVDLVAFSFYTILDRLDDGDLRPLLQISAEPLSYHPFLANVPILSGEAGFARLRAIQLRRDATEASEDAAALVDLIGSGRVVAGPKGLHQDHFKCMEGNLHAVLTDPAFIEAAKTAGYPLHVAQAEPARQEIFLARKRTAKFAPIIQQGIAKLRK